MQISFVIPCFSSHRNIVLTDHFYLLFFVETVLRTMQLPVYVPLLSALFLSTYLFPPLQVVLAARQCLGVPLPLVAPQHLAVEQRLAQALPSATPWLPQLVKCLEREQRLPAWEGLGKKLSGSYLRFWRYIWAHLSLSLFPKVKFEQI